MSPTTLNQLKRFLRSIFNVLQKETQVINDVEFKKYQIGQGQVNSITPNWSW